MVGPRNKILSSLQLWCVQPYFKKLSFFLWLHLSRRGVLVRKYLGWGKVLLAFWAIPLISHTFVEATQNRARLVGRWDRQQLLFLCKRRWPGPGAQAVVSLFGESGWGCSCWPALSQPFDLSPLGTLRGIGRSSTPRAVLGIWDPVQRRFNSSVSDLISPSCVFFFFSFNLRRAVSFLLQLCFQRVAKHLPKVKGSHRDWQLSTPAACPS